MLLRFHTEPANWRREVWTFKVGLDVCKRIDGSGFDRSCGSGNYKFIWGLHIYLGFWHVWCYLFPFVSRKKFREYMGHGKLS